LMSLVRTLPRSLSYYSKELHTCESVDDDFYGEDEALWRFWGPTTSLGGPPRGMADCRNEPEKSFRINKTPEKWT
jgi:hypothetical protein